ncbi:hypothetical protein LINGRAHAP2_LOCUS30176, partial [Linum grandiflorum]
RFRIEIQNQETEEQDRRCLTNRIHLWQFGEPDWFAIQVVWACVT